MIIKAMFEKIFNLKIKYSLKECIFLILIINIFIINDNGFYNKQINNKFDFKIDHRYYLSTKFY